MELLPEDGDVVWLSSLARGVADTVGNSVVLDDGDSRGVITQLDTAADRFHMGDTGFRFPRLHLVKYLADLEPTRPANAELFDALLDKLREYRSRRTSGPISGSGLIAALQTWNLRTVIIAVLASFAPRVLFWMWFHGMPGLGRECRWLRHQHKVLAPGKSFDTFVLGLTRQPQSVTDNETGLLATRAFLADLRAACRPRRWRGARGWRRSRLPILVLDQLDEKLPGLLAEARNDNEPDPLLVIVVSPGQRGESAFFRQVRVARDQGEDAEEDVLPPEALPSPPWPRRLLLGTAAVIVFAVLVMLWHPWSHHPAPPGPLPKPQKAACPAPVKPSGETSIVPWANPNSGRPDTECTGYSTTVPFANPPGWNAGNAEQGLQDKRLVYDQQQVFAMDRLADQYASARPVLTLVYFAGLTSAPGDDYDSGEAEELEGLLAAQKLAYSETNGPMLKVVVANGGSKMQDAVSVTRMLVPLFRRTPSLLGVVGLDRSVLPVKEAIALFGKNGVPVVATTLSANGIGAGDPAYFQLSPDNTHEAELMLSYIRDGVTEYFRQPRSVYYSGGRARPSMIWIYHPLPSDPGDLYISTMVSDLQQVRRTDPRFRSLPQVVPTTQLGAGLCGADRVVVYAGRHDLEPGSTFNTFANFLRTIDRDCPLAEDRPFVIADDGVSRFIADPAARVQPGMSQESISYVTKAIAVMNTRDECLTPASAAEVPGALGDFCRAYAGIVAHLRQELGRSVPFLWTGDRVGLAYDAANLFIQAAVTQSGQLITRAQIPAAFERQPYAGVAGKVDFTANSHTGSDTPNGMPMAIVRVEASSKNAKPTCEYTMTSGKILGFGPGHAGGSSPYLPCPSLSN